MGLLRNKHRNAQRIFYSGFDGGLNLEIPSESMPRNELKEAINVEYSHLTGALRVRGGLVWSGRFNYDVEDIIPVKGRRGFLARLCSSRLAYYFRWNNIWNVNGIITGKAGILAGENCCMLSGALRTSEGCENRNSCS